MAVQERDVLSDKAFVTRPVYEEEPVRVVDVIGQWLACPPIDLRRAALRHLLVINA